MFMCVNALPSPVLPLKAACIKQICGLSGLSIAHPVFVWPSGFLVINCCFVAAAQTIFSCPITKRSVVAMVVNVLSFQEVLYNPTMTDTSMKSLLNEYLALVHGVVAQVFVCARVMSGQTLAPSTYS